LGIFYRNHNIVKMDKARLARKQAKLKAEEEASEKKPETHAGAGNAVKRESSVMENLKEDV
jgi:hypothetical protein